MRFFLPTLEKNCSGACVGNTNSLLPISELLFSDVRASGSQGLGVAGCKGGVLEPPTPRPKPKGP